VSNGCAARCDRVSAVAMRDEELLGTGGLREGRRVRGAAGCEAMLSVLDMHRNAIAAVAPTVMRRCGMNAAR
ncbi:hypothetical protein AB4084_20785, partial [Lysobacter sp. 2RAB21]